MSKKGKAEKPVEEPTQPVADNPEPLPVQPEPQGSVDGDITGEFRGLDENPGMVAPGTVVEVPPAVLTPELFAAQQSVNDAEALARETVEPPDTADALDTPQTDPAPVEVERKGFFSTVHKVQT